MAAVVGLSAFAGPERAPAPLPSVQPSVADTLRFSVVAGTPLIVALPAQVDGAEAEYRVLEAPALSWLVDRSFMYRTVAGERGELAVRFQRTSAGREDTVVVLVTITA